MIRWSAHLSMLFRELPYLERRARWRRRFTAGEMWWPDGDADAWADETVRHGLDVSLLNAYGGTIEAGERGFLNVPERRTEAVAAVRAAIRPRRLFGDRAYHSRQGRRELRRRHIEAKIARPKSAYASALGREHWVVERSFAWLHQYRRLRVRYERRADIQETLPRRASARKRIPDSSSRSMATRACLGNGGFRRRMRTITPADHRSLRRTRP